MGKSSFYLAIEKYGLNKIGVDINNVEKDYALYHGEKNLIAISKEVNSEIYILAHEFGHYLDEFLKISSNPEIVETYMKERQALIENQSQFETTRVDYFVSSNNYHTQNINGSIEEIVAEINALLYASTTNTNQELRGEYLQQYFPETFAKVSKMFTQTTALK